MQTKWTKEAIAAKLASDDVMLERSLLVIFDRQTEDEQNTENTNHNNGRGFTGTDAPFLSSLAKQIRENKYNKPEGQRLSPKQLPYARKKMMKYAAQLARVVKERAKAEAEKQQLTAV